MNPLNIRSVIFWLCLVAAPEGQAQANKQQPVPDSGKQEFKKQAAAENPDYGKAYRMLKDQVKAHPDNAELHYFLGYAADRLNSAEGSTMNEMKKQLTLEASAHFEMVNKLQPVYKGELVVLDPYAKLSSIWGSLAQAYLIRKEKDSARWAFMEGKKRGGFIEPVLAYNRQLLANCADSSILVTYGDNITIPLWYLQEIEQYRTDVTVVDANLINTDWYPQYLKHEQQLKMSFTDEEIDKIDYVEFEPRFITISNPDDATEKFSWQLKPTYQNNYLLKGDRILLNIIKENLFTRDLYFSLNSDSTWNLHLAPYLFNEGLADKVLRKGIELHHASDSVSPQLARCSLTGIAESEIKKSQDAIFLLNGYRWMYYQNIVRLLNNKQKRKARVLKEEMNAKFPPEKLPYTSERHRAYFEALFTEFD